ncbi:hypothetical protein OEZ85_003445 [Tetradesmus obliquus]|uniref:Uncharacterized protein n=1 Tax=Tetradesmus obliquus TaxID=3088 RepID=A0ABY8UDM5_TETOB|nr:hypothetical protein OEZ85_003445 [Tetradesmus obliquus]
MLHCVPEELEDQLNASLRGLYSRTVSLALSVEAVQYCLTKEQDKLAAAGVRECAQRPVVLRATLRLTEEWLQQEPEAVHEGSAPQQQVSAAPKAAIPAAAAAILAAASAARQGAEQQQLVQGATTENSNTNTHLQQQLAQLMPLLSLDPSLGLPEVFAERGQRLFVSFAAKHGGRGAFMVSKRSMGINAEVRVLRCADGSPASAREHLMGLLLELADHGWAWEAARPRGGRKCGRALVYGAGNGLLLLRV